MRRVEESEMRVFQEKKKFSIFLLAIIASLGFVSFLSDLKGFYGTNTIIFLICFSLFWLVYIWKNELKRRGALIGLGSKQKKFSASKIPTDTPKYNYFTTQKPANNQQQVPQFEQGKNYQYEQQQRGQVGNDWNGRQYSEQIRRDIHEQSNYHGRYSLQENVFNTQNKSEYYYSSNFNQENYSNMQEKNNFFQNHLYQGVPSKLTTHSASAVVGQKQSIQKKDINKVRKWGVKNSDNQGLLEGVQSQREQGSYLEPIHEKRDHFLQSSFNGNSQPQQNQFEKTSKNNQQLEFKLKNQYSEELERELLFKESFKKQEEFQKYEQLENPIQKAKIYTFHVIKEKTSLQLKNLLEINKLLFEQFNLILSEAEIAQNMVQELETRFDLLNSAKKRITIEDLYHFKTTFDKSSHSIWPLPYDFQINNELIHQLIDLIQKREQLDSSLEIPGYQFYQVRTHVLTRLFFMYSNEDCQQDQKKGISDKFPTDIEIAAHCVFASINETCQLQKDLTVCKIEQFEVQDEKQIIPLQGEHKDKFFVLLINRINFEPFFMLQIEKSIFYTIQGPPSLFNVLVYYFMHLKNNLFPSLSYSECKETLETPAKYILNYENDYYRKGQYDRNYF